MQANKNLLPWEKATLNASEFSTTPLPQKHLNHISWALGLLGFILALFVFESKWMALLAFPLARLMAMDAHLRVLPNIYTVPLLCAGLLLSFTIGETLETLTACAIAGGSLMAIGLVGRLSGQGFGIGGGDIKLAAAAGAWLGAGFLPVYFFFACLLCMPWAFWKPKDPLPFGIGLAASFYIMLLVRFSG